MSAERCNCGTHTKAACDFAGACGKVSATLPAAPAPTDSLISILEEISVTDLAYKQRDLAAKALDILAASAPTEQAGELPPLPDEFSLFNINGPNGHRIKGYTATQMQDHYRAGVAAGRGAAVRDYVSLNDAALATPQAPTPTAAEGQAEATCDQCIELAEELQKEWMRKAIAETRTAASLFNVGGFRTGMETACDEIETRMALDGDTLLEAAEGQADLIDALRAARIQVANAANGYTTSSHETNLAKRTLEKVDSALAAPLPRQAAVQGEDTAILNWLEMRCVNVREPLRYGSRDLFWSSPEDLDGDSEPSDIRSKVRSAIATMATAPDQAKSTPARNEKD